jgi:hypothetical protein
MAVLNCELEGASIVLVGNLNPSIFQPEWLASKTLIRENEGTGAKIEVISPHVTSFVADWLTLQVTKERYTALTSDVAHFEALRDFTVGVFTLLEFTPLKQLGMNRDMHYRMESEDKWHLVGDTLAPKEIWRSLFSETPRPGMGNLTIVGRRPGSDAKQYSITVQPSVRITPPAVYIGVNEHFESEEGDAKKLITILREHWRESQAYAKKSAEVLLSHEKLRA